jgi:8-oxo-dGTP diphosphatase
MEKLDPDSIRQHKGISFVGITTCFFCHDGKGKFIMAKRSQKARDEQGRWDIGAGGLKWGVTAEDNVRREVLEEYNVIAKNVETLGYREVFRTREDGEKTHWLALDFAVLVANPLKIRIGEPDMFDDIGWFTLDTLPSPIHSQLQTHLDLYAPKLKTLQA